MASSSSNWKEKLNGFPIFCKTCRVRIVPVDLEVFNPANMVTDVVTAWSHTGQSFEHHKIEPIYHSWDSMEIQNQGYLMGMNNCSILDNPFNPNGPLHDGADSMGEAALWHKGWNLAQQQLGKVPKRTVAEPDGFDYLEAQRG